MGAGGSEEASARVVRAAVGSLPEDPAVLGLLGELAHRLRTPLGTAHGYASLLEAQVLGGELEAGQCLAWARGIQTEVERVAELLTDLSRLRALRGATLRAAAIDLRALAAEAARQVELELEQPVALEVGPPVPARGDAELLRRAIYHVLLLAQHAGREARLRVREGADAVAVEVRWREDRPRPPAYDPWLLFCQAVARAHGGALEWQPGQATLRLPGAVEAAP